MNRSTYIDHRLGTTPDLGVVTHLWVDDLRQRLTWLYGDAGARMTAMETDRAAWDRLIAHGRP